MSYIFTDEEKRILLAAINREEKFCKNKGLENLILIISSLKAKIMHDKAEKKLIEAVKNGEIQ